MAFIVQGVDYEGEPISTTVDDRKRALAVAIKWRSQGRSNAPGFKFGSAHGAEFVADPGQSSHQGNDAPVLLGNDGFVFSTGDNGHGIGTNDDPSFGRQGRHMIPGQQTLSDDVPFSIPDNVWAMLEKNKDKFPVGTVDFNEPYPWRMSAWG